jgi:hypothetical protein
MPLFPQLLVFALTLTLLAILSRWITEQVQRIGWRVTRSEQVALLGYYLLLLPGIVLHELSHIAVAWLLHMKIGKISLGPKLRGRYVELGSVQVGSGGSVRDSLVGLAPLLAGTIVLVLVGYGVFDVEALGLAWRLGGWFGVLNAANGIWRVPDFWLWAYIVFAASNAMIPSPADRQPWLPAGIYLGLALVVTYLLGTLPAIGDLVLPWVAGMLNFSTIAFLFTLALDLGAAVFLWVVELLIRQVSGQP